MHYVGMRLIHIQTAIFNSSCKPNVTIYIYNFLTIFYLSKEQQNSNLQVLQVFQKQQQINKQQQLDLFSIMQKLTVVAIF